MYAYAYHECPHCGHEIEVEVEINEGDDCPDNCPECGKPLNVDHGRLAEDAMGRAADAAVDHAKDV